MALPHGTLTPNRVEHYRRVLIARRNELAIEAARAESEATEQEDLAHHDIGDRAIALTMSGGAPSRVGR